MFTEIYKILRSYGVKSSLFNQDCQHFMNKTQISTLQIKYRMLVNFHLLGHVGVGGGGGHQGCERARSCNGHKIQTKYRDLVKLKMPA